MKIKRYAITGHTKRIGKAICEAFPSVGFSKSNGYDITNKEDRLKIIKKSADEVLSKLGVNDPTLEIAKKLEEVVLNDPYFVERKLFPNVDFYSGIIYKAMGFPIEMFTVLFALGRLPGWIAQWKEMMDDKQPIGRPRQIYTGPVARNFVPRSER